jgi:hypothetical protein
LQISLDGYTTIDLASNSKFKINEAGVNFLTYENIYGNVKYDFTKRTDKDFTYKVK